MVFIHFFVIVRSDL